MDRIGWYSTIIADILFCVSNHICLHFTQSRKPVASLKMIHAENVENKFFVQILNFMFAEHNQKNKNI